MDYKEIAAKFKRGDIVLYPTDTIWGVGCDATNEESIQKIFTIKNRPNDKPFILLVDSISMLMNFVEYVPPKIESLLTNHSQPLTIIYPKAKNLPNLAYNHDETVAIRVCHFEFTKSIITALGKPIISSSANFSSQPAPRTFQEIEKDFKNKMDFIVGEYQNEPGNKVPSVIAKILNKQGDLKFLR